MQRASAVGLSPALTSSRRTRALGARLLRGGPRVMCGATAESKYWLTVIVASTSACCTRSSGIK